MADFVLKLSCRDKPGIVAAVANTLAGFGGNIAESAQFGDPLTQTFFMRVAFNVPGDMDTDTVKKHFTSVIAGFDLNAEIYDANYKSRVLILVSKFGHCLNDLLYRQSTGALPMDLVHVASNHTTWEDRVLSEHIPFTHLPVNAATKQDQEQKLAQLIEKENIDVVVLARYMQILSEDFAKKYQGKIINIHHSFLPSFKGAKPYHQAHQKGVKLIGATAHYVTADLDEGPIIEQDVERVDHTKSGEALVAIGGDIENRVLAKALKAHLEHRIFLNGNRTVVFR